MSTVNPLAFNLQAARATCDGAARTYFAASGLRFTWLRQLMRRLALEVRSNVNALRFVSPSPVQTPNPLRWGLTIALLLVVSPRRGLYLMRLARSYAELGFFRVSETTRYSLALGVGFAIGLVIHWGLL